VRRGEAIAESFASGCRVANTGKSYPPEIWLAVAFPRAAERLVRLPNASRSRPTTKPPGAASSRLTLALIRLQR